MQPHTQSTAGVQTCQQAPCAWRQPHLCRDTVAAQQALVQPGIGGLERGRHVAGGLLAALQEHLQAAGAAPWRCTDRSRLLPLPCASAGWPHLIDTAAAPGRHGVAVVAQAVKQRDKHVRTGELDHRRSPLRCVRRPLGGAAGHR